MCSDEHSRAGLLSKSPQAKTSVCDPLRLRLLADLPALTTVVTAMDAKSIVPTARPNPCPRTAFSRTPPGHRGSSGTSKGFVTHRA